MNTNQETRNESSSVAQMGRTRFVLIYGVLFWGLVTAVVWSLLMSKLDPAQFMNWLLIAIVVFPIGGYVFGRFLWAFNRNTHRR